ncbi:aldehyde dehydrogenase family protein [Paraburkholderia sp. LEh10]|jgi:aldehyde dehydrogenase (NAD+)/betaine-aldehyde dehydrogenase|uniref:aldehyde dehydrogenase family protein n=1 Tax=Paraburkholderia sp. LEh10 TaxID=2821353 RepID=UPI001AE128A5|nr:aldehyde dehydrogenase family protein [Paraburkholderia sp. LEh10]MBP0588160.1 aldehyde dehydrogenase family protein [Paraburkholderia sp. LEh10]
MIHYHQHLIDGDMRAATGAATTTIYDSTTEAPIATIAHGSAAEVDAAVKGARAAFARWSSAPVDERAAYLLAIADALEARSDRMVESVVAEVGMPLKLTRRIQIQAPIAAWRATAVLAAKALADTRVAHSLVTKEPVGVVAAITPWNYPLHQITAKLAAALVAGCCVVLKPSELAPGVVAALCEATLEARLPRGVLNIVVGDRSTGEALVTHPGIDMVSFTGSTAAGRHIAATAGARLKRVALELGGKSASIALPDADQAAVVKHALSSCMLNSGQTCSAITRLIVPEAQYAAYREQLRAGVANLRIGDPRDADSRVGPLVSAEHRRRVNAYIERAQQAGYDDIADGAKPVLPTRGYFVAPAIFGRVPADAELAQEEVFGPVLAVQTYSTEEEAVSLANGTPYGLAGAVWSASAEHALRVARRLRAGQLDVNGAPFNASAPFGGFGASGMGREGGTFGIDEFVELRAIQLPQ